MITADDLPAMAQRVREGLATRGYAVTVTHRAMNNGALGIGVEYRGKRNAFALLPDRSKNRMPEEVDDYVIPTLAAWCASFDGPAPRERMVA